ncbi:MAG: 16S rRNA (uracil(1498)-N(3))-methyltransferase [Ignavibacteriales bacterium]
MGQDFLSNTELFYSTQIFANELKLDSDEFHHCVRVMRHSIGDKIFVTNGQGEIYHSIIESIGKNEIIAEILERMYYEDNFKNIHLCFPVLKSNERTEFAIEKCVELGITNFIFFQSKYSLQKKIKISRLEKIALAAMKQSLRSWKPNLEILSSLQSLFNLEGEKFIFDQNANSVFNNEFLVKNIFNDGKKKYLILGPEGGLTSQEISLTTNLCRLTTNRLRSETAIISVAVILNQGL